MKTKINVITVLIITINLIITFISPRCGYALNGVDSSFQKDPFIYKHTQRDGAINKYIYENSEGTVMSLEYSSRFLGRRTWVYDGQLPETGTVMLDGGSKNTINQNKDAKANFSGYDIARFDSGGFFFIPFIIPLFLVLFFRKLMLKDRKAFKILAIALMLLALLIAARLIDFLLVMV